MDCLQRTIQLTWSHRVFFTTGLFSPTNRVLREALTGVEPGNKARVLLVLDEGVLKARAGIREEIKSWFSVNGEAAELVSAPFILPGGEQVKNHFRFVEVLLESIEKHHIDRHSFVIAIGGGALLDLAGFASSIAHRGCRHIRIPTTLLSQADSGVGVKNGVNYFGKKNFIGCFSPPFAVINDFDLLGGLSPRDRRAGYVEAIKVACIRDAAFFAEIEANKARLNAVEPESVQALIRRCAELHMDHIANGGDPFEMGSRRPLDFGHWVAHKLEQLSNFRISHGEGVALGIAVDVIYSRNIGWLDQSSAGRILNLLDDLGFDLFSEELLRTDKAGRLLVLSGLDEFREHLGGRLTITLLRAIGQGQEVHEMKDEEIIKAIKELQNRKRLHG